MSSKLPGEHGREPGASSSADAGADGSELRPGLDGALALTLLALVALLLVAQHSLLLSAVVPKNSGEGWNAFHAQRALSDAALYPPLSALTSNNYPPLSFYLVGFFGRAVDDNVIAGRAVSLVSLLAIGLGIGAVVRRMTGSSAAASFSGLLFIGYAATQLENYVAMNDPQWLAHAIMMPGLVLFLASRQRRALFVFSLAFFLLAGLVKHNLIALPLALTLWLLLGRRPGRALWLGSAAGLLAAALLGLYAAFGPEFFEALLAAPRVYDPSVIALKLNAWLTPALLLFGACAVLVALDRNEPRTQLVTLYVVVAAVFGAAISGGAGVGYNAMFDVIIGLSIAAGLAVHRVGTVRRAGADGSEARVGAGVVMLVLSLVVLVAAPASLLKGWWAIQRVEKDEKAVAADLAFLARHPGPAMCEEAALCYWAGKTFDADVFNLGQKLRTGAIAEERIGELLDAHHFAVIQLNGSEGRTARLPKPTNDRIRANYRVARRNSVTGVFLVPARDPEGAE